MDHLERLRTAMAALSLLDSFQYVAGSSIPVGLPNDIRMILRRRPASALGSTVHDQFTLVVALSGSAYAIVDGSRLRLDPGTVLLIHPGQVHGYEDAEDEEVGWLFVGFHHGDAGRWSTLRGQVLTLAAQVGEDLATMLGDHFHESAHGKRHTAASERQVALRLELILERLSADLRRRLDRGEGLAGADLSHGFVQRVVAHVAAHLGEPLNIQGVARALRCSPGHLRNEFSRHTGISLGRYIRNARMRRACVLLDTTDLDIAEIGRQCGYDSLFSFSRAFRADKGIPPSTYRRNLRPVT